MLIQHFTMKGRRVPDPMRPGRTSVVGYLTASGNSELAYTDPNTGDEVTATPDEQGWLEVPHEVGVAICRHRQNGSGFYTPAEIDESVRLGHMDGAVGSPQADATRTETRSRPSRQNRRRGGKAPADDQSTKSDDSAGAEDGADDGTGKDEEE